MQKVLIIDDDPDVRTLMSVMMRKQGHEVETAFNRADALSKLKSFRPSVILLDVLLSGSDGRKLCQEIKENEKLRHIPVIMISAHPGAAESVSSFGADDFISKPINSGSLFEKIERLVKISE